MTTDELYDKISALDKDMSSVLKDQEVQNRAMLKMEVTIDKLQTLAEAMHRLISIHDERIGNNARVAEGHILQSEAQREEMSRDIKDLNTRLTQDTATLANRMDAMENRLSTKIDNLQKRFEENEKSEKETTQSFKDKFKKWQWLLYGILFVLGNVAGEHNLWASILKFLV